MFRWLNRQGVESDAGYSLQMLDRFSLEYREDSGKTLLAKVDIGFTASMKPCLIVQRKSLQEWNNSSCELTSDETEIIERRITEALRFQDMEVEIEG